MPLAEPRPSAPRAGRAAPRLGRHASDAVRRRATTRDWTDGTFVYVPRGVQRRGADRRSPPRTTQAGTALHWRDADRARGGRRGRGVGAVAVRPRREARGQQRRRARASARTRALRFVDGQDLDESSVGLRHPARRGRRATASLDWIALGFGSAQRQGLRMETQLAGAGADAQRHRRLRHARAPAPRLRHDCRSTPRPTRRRDLAFRGILADRSSAVWRGMIKVDPGAQQTDAFQESRNLLLSKKAHADAIPGLEILANDVRCTHAAAIAQIDPEQLFYLRSHGLRRGRRRSGWSIEGFLQALVERFEEGPVREAVGAALERRLARSWAPGAAAPSSMTRAATGAAGRSRASWRSTAAARCGPWRFRATRAGGCLRPCPRTSGCGPHTLSRATARSPRPALPRRRSRPSCRAAPSRRRCCALSGR